MKNQMCTFWGRQRQEVHARALFLLICAGALLFVTFTPTDHPAQADCELTTRINPNNASAQSLMRLPSIGPARAHAIIAYRQTTPSKAFKNPSDLEKVKGIGPKTAEGIKKYLEFD